MTDKTAPEASVCEANCGIPAQEHSRILSKFESKHITMRTDLITIDPETSGGMPLFAGSWVPLANVFDYLNGGTKTLQDFCDDYPTVDPQQLREFLQLAKRTFANPDTVRHLDL
jgi:uncharacterized protein (DUF433 family)